MLTSGRPTFDIASIKASQSTPGPVIAIAGSRFAGTATLKTLIKMAYHVQDLRLRAILVWAGTQPYDVVAIADGLTNERFQLMLQALLADRSSWRYATKVMFWPSITSRGPLTGVPPGLNKILPHRFAVVTGQVADCLSGKQRTDWPRHAAWDCCFRTLWRRADGGPCAELLNPSRMSCECAGRSVHGHLNDQLADHCKVPLVPGYQSEALINSGCRNQ